MHAYRTAQGTAISRVLYLFRSPSSIKVGRTALDDEVVAALEHTHPDLAFDWAGMLREPSGIARPPDRARSDRPPRRPARAPDRVGRAPEPSTITLEDETLLGRTLGAGEALRLRGRYAELTQRVVRRAPSPEERDRLTERLSRLNPDEWPDEVAARAAAVGVEAEWEAIAAELPRRRRGRRGGRRQEQPGSSSAIIEHTDENHNDDGKSAAMGLAGTPDGGTAGGGGGVGPGEPGLVPDISETAPAAGTNAASPEHNGSERTGFQVGD
jgi:hypothetical protein